MGSTQIVVLGEAAAAGTSAGLDVFQDSALMVRPTQTWHSIMARILTDWVEDDVEMIHVSTGPTGPEPDALSPAPDHVLVMFGSDTVVSEEILAHHPRPILMTPPPVSERMTAHGCTINEVRERQARTAGVAQAVRDLAHERSLAVIDLHGWFLDHRLAYDHLFEGRLPDAVAQSAMASFVAGELLPLLGVHGFPKPLLCDYRKVYSDAQHPLTRHSGFTDLTFFQGHFYVAFRSGHCHGLSGSKGRRATTIVLRSQDGITWVKDAELWVEGFVETRDPKFLQAGDRLLLYGVCWPVHEQPDTYWKTYGFERLASGTWSPPFP